METAQRTEASGRSLEDALERLAGAAAAGPFAPALDLDAVSSELEALVIAQIPAFSASANPDLLPELAGHLRRHCDELTRLLGGGAVGDFEFVREHARRRAEQRFPLEAVLHAYRCGHKVFSRRLREAVRLPALADLIGDFAMEYSDTISTIAAAEYVAHTRLLTAVAGDQRAALLRLLIEGHDESDGRVAGLLRDAGYLDRRQSFCVALAQPVDPAEMQNPARARRLADSIDGVLRVLSGRRLIDVRDNKVTIVCSYPRRQSGWTAPNTALAGRMTDELARVGPAALIGVGNDAPSTAHIPSAYREAQLALELADVTTRVVQFSDVPLRRMLVHLAGRDARLVLPAWTRELLRADDAAGGALVATLRAYADADMNVLKAAKALRLHPNTVYARLQRISDACGLDPRSYHALTEMLLAADCRS